MLFEDTLKLYHGYASNNIQSHGDFVKFCFHKRQKLMIKNTLYPPGEPAVKDEVAADSPRQVGASL